ncbi:MAG TPA: hypothetical protein VFA18_11340, partial [Gemmataceae bacterium]|nr:hypothetical protein [Gemmataceae bacterium]
MNAKRVLSVGQCFADHHAISRTLRQHYAADVSEAGTVEEALAQLRQNQFDLVLVNRVFDANGCEGVALIEQ